MAFVPRDTSPHPVALALRTWRELCGIRSHAELHVHMKTALPVSPVRPVWVVTQPIYYGFPGCNTPQSDIASQPAPQEQFEFFFAAGRVKVLPDVALRSGSQSQLAHNAPSTQRPDHPFTRWADCPVFELVFYQVPGIRTDDDGLGAAIAGRGAARLVFHQTAPLVLDRFRRSEDRQRPPSSGNSDAACKPNPFSNSRPETASINLRAARRPARHHPHALLYRQNTQARRRPYSVATAPL